MASSSAMRCLERYLIFAVTWLCIVDVGSQEYRFTVDPQPVTARLGENVSVRCTIYPPADILWFVNGFPLISNTSYDFKFDGTTGEHEIIIKNISMDQDGQYFCRMQNKPVKPLKSQPAQVTVLVPPSQIRLVPFNPVTVVQESLETSLTCNVNGGKPAPSVIWLKDDIPIEFGVDTHFVTTDAGTKIENVTSTLKWTPIRGENEKRIFCTATHQALQGGPLRVETQLIVEYAPAAKIISVPEVIREGDSVTLQCIADANPYIDLKFRWTKNGLPIQPDVSGGSLYIEHVQRSERAALYTCEATNKIGTNSAGYLLDVQYGPSFFSMPDIKPADMKSDAFLTCNVDSNPPAVITWLRDTSSQVIGREKVLKAPLLTESDFGIYSCVAAAPGYPPIRKDMKILQKSRPSISAEASVYAGQGDSSAQIKCVINGLPLPESIRWTNPQGHVLSGQQGDRRVEISQDVLSDRVISRLTIRNVKKEDFGMYNCSATNAYGRDGSLIPLKETDWILSIIIGCTCGGALLLVVIVVTAILCIRSRSHRRLKQASDTSGSTTTSDDLETKSPNGAVGHKNGILDMYNTSSNETLHDSKHPSTWHDSRSPAGHQDTLHPHPYTIHSDYALKDPQNYYTRYANYEEEYNPNSFSGLPAIYTPTLSIIEQQEQEGSRDPSPYHTSGLPTVNVGEPLYSRYPAINGSVMMLDTTLNSRLATNV